LIANVKDPEHIFTPGFPQEIQVYTTCCDGAGINIPMYFLNNHPAGLSRALNIPTHSTQIILGYAVNNTLLRDGIVSNSKTVFFLDTPKAAFTSSKFTFLLSPT